MILMYINRDGRHQVHVDHLDRKVLRRLRARERRAKQAENTLIDAPGDDPQDTPE